MTSVAQPVLETAGPTPTRSLGDTFVGRRYVQLVVVLGALMAIGPLTIDTYLPALPQLATDMGATDAQVQLTITGLLLGLGLGQLFIGPLSDAFGRPAPVADRPRGARRDVSALCRGPVGGDSHRDANPAGPGRRGRGGGRHGHRPRPVRRDPGRPAAVPADPGARRGADPRPVAGQCVAHVHVLAGHLRGARRGRRRPVAAGLAGVARDPAAGPPPSGHRTRHSRVLPAAVPRPHLPGDGRRGRSDVRHPLRLHLRRPVHPAGSLRPLPPSVRRRLQCQRRRADPDDPAQPAAGRPVTARSG